MSENKYKRKAFALKEKCEIIRDLQTGKKQSEVCRERNLSKSTVGTIWKSRDALLAAFENTNANAKKLRKSVHDDVDKMLLKWFTQQRLNNATISGAILKTKAEEFGRKIQDEFVCSEAWIDRWKTRHNVNCGKIVGESADVDPAVVNAWITTVWPTIMQGYQADDIFNADEAGLFYKLTPDKTLKFKGERCKGGKLSKERITILVCANMSGREKRKLLVIGKTKNPRCFKNVKSLPVDYHANGRAWMTSEVFNNYVRKWDEELTRKKRKIILLIDNCPAHPKIENLNSIKLVFMPPNTSSKLQPMDQGIIHSLKSHYRQALLVKIIQGMDAATPFKPSILDAINLIHRAWQKVTIQTIKNCYKHAGFYVNITENEFDADDEIPLQDWLSKQTSEASIAGQPEFITIPADFVTIDDDLVTSEFLTDDDIVSAVRTEDVTDNECDEKTDSEDETATSQVEVLSVNSAIQSLSELRHFVQAHGAPQHILNSLAELESYTDVIAMNNQVQRKITDYFKKDVTN